jgi:hypothetical protein
MQRPTSTVPSTDNIFFVQSILSLPSHHSISQNYSQLKILFALCLHRNFLCLSGSQMSPLTPPLFHCHHLSLLHPSDLKILLHLLPCRFNAKPLSILTHQCSSFPLISFHVQLFSSIWYSLFHVRPATSRSTFLSLIFLSSFPHSTDMALFSIFAHFLFL